MSLFATDEQNAYSDGFTNGEKAGFKKALSVIEKWIENDQGMISVISIRKKINELRERAP